MHPIAFPRSRRFMVAVAATLAALLMVAVTTAVKSAHSQTTSTTTTRAFSGFHDKLTEVHGSDLTKIATAETTTPGGSSIRLRSAVCALG